ncbi:MAG: 23S rRNA pseudouridine(955/2504/2580) synthase RluC [Gammaproteobacteria bacterium]
MTARESAPKAAVRLVTVSDDQAGQRIDNFLSSRLKGVPKSRLYRLLRKGEVRVNKGRIGPAYRIQAGDIVRIPPVRMAAKAAPMPAAATLEFLSGRIVHEDKRLLVLDKPAGMAVHGGSGLSFGVIEALRAARPDAPFLELVHRLDRDTSGCLMIAKRRSYLRSLHDMLRQGAVEKQYLALVRGQWQLGKILLEDRLATHQRRDGERHVELDASGKLAASRFRPVEIWPRASLIEVALLTGRTHQIRVQATAAGHPLAGDDKYGDPVFNRQMARIGLKRMFLHAHSLSFDDPVSGEPRSFSAPLPADLGGIIDKLGKGA